MDVVQFAQAAAPFGQIGALIVVVLLFLRAQERSEDRRADSEDRLASALDGLRDAVSDACAYRSTPRRGA